MSYILEALRKSEEDRHQGQVPHLGMQGNLVRPAQKKSALWPALIFIALLVNGAGLLYWQMNQSETALLTGSAMPTQERPVENKPVQNMPNQPIFSAKVDVPIKLNDPIKRRAPIIPSPVLVEAKPYYAKPQKTVKTALPANRVVESTEAIVASDPYSDLPWVSELSPSVQRNLPAFQFNSHIYSDNPSARRAMINHVYLREGQRFSGVILEAVTDEGVVINANGVRFRLPALKDWSYQ